MPDRRELCVRSRSNRSCWLSRTDGEAATTTHRYTHSKAAGLRFDRGTPVNLEAVAPAGGLPPLLPQQEEQQGEVSTTVAQPKVIHTYPHPTHSSRHNS